MQAEEHNLEIYTKRRQHPRWDFRCDFSSIISTDLSAQIKIVGINASATGVGVACFNLDEKEEPRFSIRLRRRTYPLRVKWSRVDSEKNIKIFGLEIDDLIFRIGIKNNDPHCDVRYLLIQEQIVSPQDLTFSNES